jgi:hypothetical protein
MTRKKKKALYALAMLVLLGCGLMTFIIAADEQSVILSGLPAADRIRLQDLIAQGSAKNKHVELLEFYFGKRFIYTTELAQFNDVYVPVFPSGQSESANNLQFLSLLALRNVDENLFSRRRFRRCHFEPDLTVF